MRSGRLCHILQNMASFFIRHLVPVLTAASFPAFVQDAVNVWKQGFAEFFVSYLESLLSVDLSGTLSPTGAETKTVGGSNNRSWSTVCPIVSSVSSTSSHMSTSTATADKGFIRLYMTIVFENKPGSTLDYINDSPNILPKI